MKQSRQWMIAAIIMLCGTITLFTACSVDNASTSPLEPPGEEFSMVTLNVDGLPQKISILGIFDVDINTSGPGETYSSAISQYLARKGYDIIAVQENFNFNTQICSALDADYLQDEWSGEVSMANFNWDGMYFPFDGVNMFWRKTVKVATNGKVHWTENYGKFDHAWDDIIKKGFRRYDIQLKGGSQLVLYNMHMDASDDADEAKGEDGPDRAARLKQWKQLRDSILNNLDKRPVIVCGDLNTWYARDSIKTAFIDYIEATGKATVGDVWINLMRNGKYPEMVEGIVTKDEGAIGWSRNGETLDKILYINPTGGNKLIPLSVDIDQKGYIREDGEMLGDHFPLSATFRLQTSF